MISSVVLPTQCAGNIPKSFRASVSLYDCLVSHSVVDLLVSTNSTPEADLASASPVSLALPHRLELVAVLLQFAAPPPHGAHATVKNNLMHHSLPCDRGQPPQI